MLPVAAKILVRKRRSTRLSTAAVADVPPPLKVPAKPPPLTSTSVATTTDSDEDDDDFLQLCVATEAANVAASTGDDPSSSIAEPASKRRRPLSIGGRMPCNIGEDECLFVRGGIGEDDELYLEHLICDGCERAIHFGCAGLASVTDEWEMNEFYCVDCVEEHGPSVKFVEPSNRHRHNPFEHAAETKPMQIATPAWIDWLLQAESKFSDAEDVIYHNDGSDITEEFFARYGFDTPILIRSAPDSLKKLRCTMPLSTVSLDEIRDLIGDTETAKKVLVIDSRSQTNTPMSLDDLIRYMNNDCEDVREMRRLRTHVYNCVSLEFSNTRLRERVVGPDVAEQLNWTGSGRDAIVTPSGGAKWPRAEEKSDYFCLMTAAGSYTDFHIDFGGTSVWYHIVRGEKVFYLIPPKECWLTEFREWQTEVLKRIDCPNHLFNRIAAENVFRLHLREGDTVFLPSGWMHAVYTPCESLVFGGNFLHTYAIASQIQVMQMERQLKFAFNYCYPNPEVTAGFALSMLMRRMASGSGKPAAALVNAARLLFSFLAPRGVTSKADWTRRLTTRRRSLEKMPANQDFPWYRPADANSQTKTCNLSQLLKAADNMLKKIAIDWPDLKDAPSFVDIPPALLDRLRRRHEQRQDASTTNGHQDSGDVLAPSGTSTLSSVGDASQSPIRPNADSPCQTTSPRLTRSAAAAMVGEAVKRLPLNQPTLAPITPDDSSVDALPSAISVLPEVEAAGTDGQLPTTPETQSDSSSSSSSQSSTDEGSVVGAEIVAELQASTTTKFSRELDDVIMSMEMRFSPGQAAALLASGFVRTASQWSIPIDKRLESMLQAPSPSPPPMTGQSAVNMPSIARSAVEDSGVVAPGVLHATKPASPRRSPRHTPVASGGQSTSLTEAPTPRRSQRKRRPSGRLL